jgi:hypothetical protein
MGPFSLLLSQPPLDFGMDKTLAVFTIEEKLLGRIHPPRSCGVSFG